MNLSECCGVLVYTWSTYRLLVWSRTLLSSRILSIFRGVLRSRFDSLRWQCSNIVTFSREFERNFPLVYSPTLTFCAPHFFFAVFQPRSCSFFVPFIPPFKLPFTFLPMGSLTFAKLPLAACALLEFRLTIRLFAAYGICTSFVLSSVCEPPPPKLPLR